MHEMVAGPQSIVEQRDEVESSYLATEEFPLLYLEFPYPSSTLMDWLLGRGGRAAAANSSNNLRLRSISSTDLRLQDGLGAAAVAAERARGGNGAVRGGSGGGGSGLSGHRRQGSGGNLMRQGSGGEEKNKGSRSPWEVQHMARQVVSVLSIVHSQQSVHGALDPHMVDVEENTGRVVLRVLRVSTTQRRRREYRAPELEEEDSVRARRQEERRAGLGSAGGDGGNSGGGAAAAGGGGGRERTLSEIVGSGSAASDMYAFGVLLFWMNFPERDLPVAGTWSLPGTTDANLRSLLERLLDVNPANRPSASDALVHPFFTTSFSDRLVASGEILRQDDKLEAVRALIKQVRHLHSQNKEKIAVDRLNGKLVSDVLEYFRRCGGDPEGARALLKVQFLNEAGLDEGGLTSEMFTLFFDGIVTPEFGLFECAGGDDTDSRATSPADEDGSGSERVSGGQLTAGGSSGGVGGGGGGRLYLPIRSDTDAAKADNGETEDRFRSIGRAIVKCFYEGKRIGSRFAPSLYKYLAHGQDNKLAHSSAMPRGLDDLKRYDPDVGASLEWLLDNSGVEHLGMDFEDVPGEKPQPVNDVNKGSFVRRKIKYMLVGCRVKHLEAIRSGFWQALMDLSPEAAPFLRLLSPMDWSVLLCGEDNLKPADVVAVLEFNGYSPRSLIPKWLPQTILQFSPDNLRRFLIFCTGAPSLPPKSSSSITIVVQYNRASEALPIAHTCFYKLDLPDYPDQDMFVSKLMKAIQECATFDRV